MSKLASFEYVREEDFVEYFLFPQLTTNNVDTEKTKHELKNILQQITEIAEKHCHNYIWHKDEFFLSIRSPEQNALIDEEYLQKDLPPHLYGISHYGDNIQDEWFIVYLIFEITKKIPNLIARIVDSDGEFLLIEGADYLPDWASPEKCEQRVYIHNGCLLLDDSSTNSDSVLTVQECISRIWNSPSLYKVSDEMQNTIEERFADFKCSEPNFFHYQIVKVPLAIAAILKQKPSLIAASVRAFCERDSYDKNICRAMRYFPPENCVKTRIKFTRCLYAMLTSSRYTPDSRTGWTFSKPETEDFKEEILGVKIACGFEILCSQAKENCNFETDREWKMYLQRLTAKGYFKDFIQDTKDYTKLMMEAKEFYKENRNRFKKITTVGKDVLSLLRNSDINTEELRNEETNLPKSDNDEWLNISSEDLDALLIRKYGLSKIYKSDGNLNAPEFSGQISDFLERKSDYDGIENSSTRRSVKKSSSMRKAVENNPINPTNPGKSNEINFDPDAFQVNVKNFLDFVVPEDDWESNSEMSDYEDEDVDKNIEDMTNIKASFQEDFRAYIKKMDEELARTNVAKTFASPKRASGDDFDDIESFEPIDIDANTVRNMMHSYKSQLGGPGPASNLLNSMGIGVSTEITKETEENDINLDGTQV